MKTLSRVSFLLIIVLGTFSCSRGPKGSEYFSAPDNERQTYSIKLTTPTRVGTMEGTVIIRQDGTTDIGGKKYYKSVTTFEGIPGLATSETIYSHLADDGIYSRKSTDTDSLETIEIPFPPDVGRKWNYRQGDLSMEMEIAAVETLDTSEKTFTRCLKVIGKGTRAGEPIKIISHYAPKFGLVKSSMTGQGFAMEMKLHLK